MADHSFVVLAYGESPFLAGCLASLAAQSPPSRILVSTSTPSPHVARAAKAVDAELRINPERAGIASDWNFGLTQVETPFVTLAHQDDVYFPAFAERTMALFA
ncbi:MAG TPA: glycosyltransferase family A protein, partial [Caulobacteraceae bacterium]|nr:glycosyltransferase family A protein [Caulobacteraceae bacterium]